jgi:predicted ATPase
VPIVVDICRKLDGIPLAIELAGASIDALGLQGVASRLDYPLRLPTTRRRSAAPRHHTLRSSLDWSYRLLTGEEQRALRRLSVFAGSFTVDAAAAAAADRNYTKSETVDRVAALVAKSLVAVDADGSGTRLRLLATTRAYALDNLAESGEVDAIAWRQAGISQYLRKAAAWCEQMGPRGAARGQALRPSRRTHCAIRRIADCSHGDARTSADAAHSFPASFDSFTRHWSDRSRAAVARRSQ